MKLKKSLIALFVILSILFLPSCEGPDPEDVAKVIEQATAIAYNEVIHKNPDLEEPIAEMAYFSLAVLEDGKIDAMKAREMLNGALTNFSCLDADEKRIIVDMFSIVIPLIDLPREGVLNDTQLMFVKSFFQGIVNAVELKEQLETDECVETKLSRLLDG
jgi:hypothetical protein